MKIQLIPFSSKINDRKGSTKKKPMKQKNRERSHSAIAALLGIINSLTRGMSRVYEIHIHKKKYIFVRCHSIHVILTKNGDTAQWLHHHISTTRPLAGKRKKEEKEKLNIHHHRKEKLRPVQSIWIECWKKHRSSWSETMKNLCRSHWTSYWANIMIMSTMTMCALWWKKERRIYYLFQRVFYVSYIPLSNSCFQLLAHTRSLCD